MPKSYAVSVVLYITSPAIGDVDEDGDIEIGIATNEAVNNGSKSVSYLIDASTASVVEGWYATLVDWLARLFYYR